MDDVLTELGEPVVVDYVRLNIDAPPASGDGAGAAGNRAAPAPGMSQRTAGADLGAGGSR